MLNAAILRRIRHGGNPLAAYAANGVFPALVADFSNGVYLGAISSFADFTESNTNFVEVDGERGLAVNAATDALSLASGVWPAYTDDLCISMSGYLTYSDNNSLSEAMFYNVVDGSNYARCRLRTDSAQTGLPEAGQSNGTYDPATAGASYSPGTKVPFSIAVRHGATHIQAAADGAAGSENATPTSLADLSGQALPFATVGDFVITKIVIWNKDIGQAGIEAASANSAPLLAHAVNGVLPDVLFYPPTGYYVSGREAVALADIITLAGGATVDESGIYIASQTETAQLTSALRTSLTWTGAVNIAVDGFVSYNDNADANELWFWRNPAGTPYFTADLQTTSTLTGRVRAYQNNGTSTSPTAVADPEELTPGSNVAFSIAARYTPTAVQVALNGTVGTEQVSTVSLATPGSLYFGYPKARPEQNFNIWRIRMWFDADLGEGGVEEASGPFPVLSAGVTPRSVKKTLWAYGDSLTQSGYPSYLQALAPDAYANNLGLGGQGTRHVGARMGAISATMTVSGNSVSAGANTVTHINGYAISAGMGNDGGDGSLNYEVNQFLSFAQNTTQTVTGTLNGIAGTLTRTATGTFPATTEIYTFTPDAGETLPASVPAGSTWATDTDYLTVNTSEDIVVLWTGQNDMGFGEQAERFGGYIGSVITLLENSGVDYIVMGPVTWTTSDTAWQTGGSFYNEVETSNSTLSTLAGSSYFDVAAFLRTNALSYAGLTATTEDLADIANGMPPRQLRKDYTAPEAGWDAVHFNANGYAAIAQRLSEIKAARGL